MSFVFGGPMFFVSQVAIFKFFCDLDIWAQGQGLRSFPLECVLLLFDQKYEGDFDQTWQEANTAIWHMT